MEDALKWPLPQDSSVDIGERELLEASCSNVGVMQWCVTVRTVTQCTFSSSALEVVEAGVFDEPVV